MQLQIESSMETSVDELVKLLESFEGFDQLLHRIIFQFIHSGLEKFPACLSESALGAGDGVSHLAIGRDIEFVISALRALNVSDAHNILTEVSESDCGDIFTTIPSGSVMKIRGVPFQIVGNAHVHAATRVSADLSHSVTSALNPTHAASPANLATINLSDESK